MNTDDKKLLIQLICEKQTNMIVKNPMYFQTEEYIRLEELKVKIKNMEE